MDQSNTFQSPTNPTCPPCRKSPLPLIGLVITAALAVAGWTLGLTNSTLINDKDVEIQQLKTKLSQQTANTPVDTDRLVQDFITEFETIIEKSTSRGYYKTFNENFPNARTGEMKVPTALTRAYGLNLAVPLIDHTQYDKNRAIIIAELKKLGFEHDINVANGDFLADEEEGFLNSKTGIACYLPYGSSNLNFACGHISWLPDTDLTNELAEAYKTATGSYPLNIASIRIEDSSVAPYQRLFASFGNAAQLFYRTDTDAEWQYFTDTQTAIDCSDFNTADLKNAFAGETCYDGTNNSTVKP